jgi:hypothetical protein
MVSLYDNSLTISQLIESNTIILNPIQEASVLCFTRSEKFIGGYYVYDHIKDLYKKFFGNTEVLQNVGLIHQLNSLQIEVEKDNLIGLILYGVKAPRDEVIDTYPTNNNKIIDLTIRSISRSFIRQCYNDEMNLNNLCKLTPNFNIYYNGM